MGNDNVLDRLALATTELSLNSRVEDMVSPIVIVGNGPVGIKTAQLLIKKEQQNTPHRSTSFEGILIFGEELRTPYNRVQLSLYLAGKVSESDLDNPIAHKDKHSVKECLGRKVIAVDRKNKIVTDNLGGRVKYSKLILATGSNARMPELCDLSIKNIYLFRTFSHSQEILKQKNSRQHFYIVGSGSLGLETAVALKTEHNKVTIESRNYLFHNDLDDLGQQILSNYLTNLGIDIIFNDPLKQIKAEDKIESVELTSGRIILVDCLIFCVGITPETTLARRSDLKVNNGILVDEYMRTSDHDIYAVGECSEHQQQTYGVVAPGFMQAETCVEHIFGNHKKFENQQTPIQAKFTDYSTACYGKIIVDDSISYTYIVQESQLYRKLIVKDKKIVGAIIVGNWVEESNIKIAISEKSEIEFKSFKRFEKTGLLFEQESPVKQLPVNYVVCLCENVTRGELSNALESGCRTIDGLGKKTGAGTVCGSCQPMILNLLDTPAPNLVMRHQRAILVTSILSILSVFFIFLFFPAKIADTVQVSWSLEKLWFDNFWKQVSGYTLLGLCVVAVALSARKRIKKFRLGHVDGWRYAHSIIGYSALLILMVHTGLRLGNNLNFALMLVFLCATLMGSLVGVFMAKNHHWSDFKLRQYRLWLSRLHHTILWMLLPLLSFHILSVYYF